MLWPTLLLLPAVLSRSHTHSPAVPPNYVVDLAGVLDDATERRLNAYLRELKQKTTVQMVVLTLRSLDGRTSKGFSIGTVEKWEARTGEERDNGVLLTVSVQDRAYRFEVGYGLEGSFPTVWRAPSEGVPCPPTSGRGTSNAGICECHACRGKDHCRP
ncbi:MAG: TPM domain-containing protein [Thermodesulfovibrionales bacterium]